jgi:hypothetical protein
LVVLSAGADGDFAACQVDERRNLDPRSVGVPCRLDLAEAETAKK